MQADTIKEEASQRGVMADYRIYCLTSTGGLNFADWIEADTDDAAIEQAKKLQPAAHRCEVWLGHVLSLT